MRFLFLSALTFAAVAGTAAEVKYPLWDGQGAVVEYAKRTGLEPTRTLDLGGGVKLELVLIPAGKFVMGTPEPKPVKREGLSERALSEAEAEYEAALARFKGSYYGERPAHEVTISVPFYMGKFEVTQEQFQQVMQMNPSKFRRSDLPVERVSWNDTREFCKKTSEKMGQAVRLPTEAEWEYACRSGTRTSYSAGDAGIDLDRVGWYTENSGNATHPVGQKSPNVWGVHDMHGNVCEWCSDFFSLPYTREAEVDPRGPAAGEDRVLRGGSWDYLPEHCRSSSRAKFPPGKRDDFIGFRVVMLITSPEPKDDK